MNKALLEYGNLVVNARAGNDPEMITYQDQVSKAPQNAELRIKQLEDIIQGKREYKEQWEDLRLAASAVKVTGATNLPAYGSWIGDLQMLWFDVADQVFFEVQLPHAWKEGTVMRPHVHWTPEADWTGSDDVEWNIEYVVANINGTFPSSSTTITGNRNLLYPVTFRTYEHRLTPLPYIEMTDKLVSCMLVGRLYRGSDDFDHQAGLLELDFHILKDELGSTNEFIKDEFVGSDEGIGKDFWS